MNYKNKYIKYKIKYINLKGGKILYRNYYLHIRFSKEFEDKIDIIKNILSDNTFLLSKDIMPSHITLSYGPRIEFDDKIDPFLYEIKNASDFNIIYPGFIEEFKDRVIDITYVKVSPFLRTDNIVIKLEIESKTLLEMLIFCRKNIQSYNKLVQEWKDSYEQTKHIIMKKFPTIFKEEQSFDDIPVGALHITLITLKHDTPEDVITNIIKIAESELSKIGINKGSNIIADRIDLKTPITKKFIDILYFHKSISL